MKSLCHTIILFGMAVFCDSLTSSSDESATRVTDTLSTLSTAKRRSSASPRPSSLYRRINVERVEEITSSPLDLFLVRDPERRSQMESVWKWDFWCQLQPKIGNCSSAQRQQQGGPRQNFYYDAQLDTCVSFTYSGCDGNKNNFQTVVDCERHCKGSAYMALKETTRTTYCALQPNAGLCMALLQRFYYDVNGDECKTFIYGGCGGNQNRFKTKSLCIQRCKEEE